MYSDWNIERTKTHNTFNVLGLEHRAHENTHSTFNVLGLEHRAHETHITHLMYSDWNIERTKHT